MFHFILVLKVRDLTLFFYPFLPLSLPSLSSPSTPPFPLLSLYPSLPFPLLSLSLSPSLSSSSPLNNYQYTLFLCLFSFPIAPTLIASPPSNASYLEGTNVTLSCTTLGLPLPIISWQRQCQGSSLTPIQTTVNEFQHQLASGVYRLTSDLVLHNVTHQDDSCYYHCNARSKATLASNTDSAVAIVTIQSK